MATLTEPQQRFIVQRLAFFETPSEVAEAVKETFGIVITRQQVHNYDPDHGQPSKKWRAIFDATRKEFLASQAKIAIGQKSFRLNELQKLYRSVISAPRKNVVLAADLLEQAAKESGDAFMNQRAQPVVVESEDSRIQRMRATMAAMDDVSAPPPAAASTAAPSESKS